MKPYAVYQIVFNQLRNHPPTFLMMISAHVRIQFINYPFLLRHSRQILKRLSQQYVKASIQVCADEMARRPMALLCSTSCIVACSRNGVRSVDQ